MALSNVSKDAIVKQLIQRLESDLKTSTLTDVQRAADLGQLKVHGRDLNGADAMYSHHGFSTLCQYAFGKYPVNVSQEALRCIANAMWLQPSLRSIFVDLGNATAAAVVYQQADDDFEFLGARILFLLTYQTSTDFQELIDTHALVQSIERHFKRHTESIMDDNTSITQKGEMAMAETSKLIFNLGNKLPSELPSLSIVVPSLSTVLRYLKPAGALLDGTTGFLINALAILDIDALTSASAAATAQTDYTALTLKLMNVMETAVDKGKPAHLDVKLIPLVTILQKLYDMSTAEARSLMQQRLLPNDSDRNLPLGQSSSLSSKLLRLASSPGLVHLSEAIPALMFEMSDRDATQFVRNIGYGHAAGFLMKNEIAIPDSVKEHGVGLAGVPTNPITGQRLDRETVPDEPEMTQEEKEREAERLFVLFERLKATGVVDVENPVAQALRSGQSEETGDGVSKTGTK